MAKRLISIRLDTDLVTWLRQRCAHGYQTKINQILCAYKDREQTQQHFVLGRAQEIFRQYHSRCFWHLQKDLKITPQLISVVQSGLRKYGGREGYQLAAELTLIEE